MSLIRMLVASSLLVFFGPAIAAAQEGGETEGPSAEYDRRKGLALLGGMGKSFAWLGVSGDLYFSAERFSVFGSLGYIPDTDDNGLSGATVAGGVRAYKGGARHRIYLELGVSEIQIKSKKIVEPDGTLVYVGTEHIYGPIIQVGYRFAARDGFTLLTSLGVGYGLPDGPTSPALSIGMGYTWP